MEVFDPSAALQGERRSDTNVTLPESLQVVAVPTVLRRETRFLGEVPPWFRVVPNKPPLVYGDEFLYPEFVVLRLLNKSGWSGVWVKNWGGKREFWTDISATTELPSQQVELYKTIKARTSDHRGGCWDIIAWQGSETLFIESKQKSNDRIRPSQAAWLESALELGVPLSSFLIAEYVMDRPPVGKKREHNQPFNLPLEIRE